MQCVALKASFIHTSMSEGEIHALREILCRTSMEDENLESYRKEFIAGIDKAIEKMEKRMEAEQKKDEIIDRISDLFSKPPEGIEEKDEVDISAWLEDWMNKRNSLLEDIEKLKEKLDG